MAKRKIKSYSVDIDMHGIDTFHCKAANKPEARRKAIAHLRRRLNHYIQHAHVEIESDY